MRSIFSDIDMLIERAVADATSTESEKAMQKKQAKEVKKHGFEADKEEEADKAEEAEDDKPEDKVKKKDDPGDESVKKMKGEPEGKNTVTKNDKAVVPGTQTSKKLDDPSPKTMKNPNFDDFKNKINALRGSASLKDETVAGSIKGYLGTLDSAEKAALLTYLTNLAQIMSTVKSSHDVKDPGKMGIKTMFKPKKSHSEKSDSDKPSPPRKDGVIVVGEKT